VSADVKEELKEISTRLKDLVKQQKTNLENYLVIQRKWDREAWQSYFLANPVAFAFAQNFVWAAYDGDKMTQTFAVGADGTLKDVDGRAVTLGKQKIGLVHPLDLRAEATAAWRGLLASASIVPPFEQLDRPVVQVSPDEAKKALSYEFEEKTVFGATFKSRAERLGWRRGSVVDAGEVSSYRKAFDNKKVEAFVRLNGLGVQSYESEVTLGELFFVKLGSIVTGSYTYDEPRSEGDERLLRFADVPAIVYSETVADLRQITKSKDDDED
jgi:hypothetical protein